MCDRELERDKERMCECVCVHAFKSFGILYYKKQKSNIHSNRLDKLLTVDKMKVERLVVML